MFTLYQYFGLNRCTFFLSLPAVKLYIHLFKNSPLSTGNGCIEKLKYVAHSTLLSHT